uniref:Endonuclease/exonuclease/phosphatase domain-containing protein n=1 Tax=Cacopsylla melanoneura TaxID=428564 RepID=A0A8D8Z3L4_9HEMI
MRGGGVLVAIKKQFQSRPLITMNRNTKTIQTVWVKLKLYGQEISLCACYFPPYVHPNTLKEFVDETCNHHELSNNNIIFIGDFNIKEYIDPLQENSNRMTEIKKLNNFFNLEQFNEIQNKNSRILDLCLTNICRYKISKNKIPTIKIERTTGLTPPVGHHPPLDIAISLCIDNTSCIQSDNKAETEKSRNYNKADYISIKNELNNTNWNNLLQINKIENITDELMDIFYKELNKILDKHVPKTRLKKNNFPIWWTYDTKKIYKQKERLRKIKNKSNNQKNKYQHLRKQCKKDIKTNYVSYIEEMSKNIKNDSKKFWKYYKKYTYKCMSGWRQGAKVEFTNVHKNILRN